MMETTVLRFTPEPRVAGTYWLGGIGTGIGFTLTERPLWWHRFWMRVCLGWEWTDPQEVR